MLYCQGESKVIRFVAPVQTFAFNTEYVEQVFHHWFATFAVCFILLKDASVLGPNLESRQRARDHDTELTWYFPALL